MSKVILYTTPFCGFCHAAKALLDKKNVEYQDVNVAGQPELRNKISKENGNYRTVPMIFIGDKFIGGFTELAQLESSGELNKLLES